MARNEWAELCRRNNEAGKKLTTWEKGKYFSLMAYEMRGKHYKFPILPDMIPSLVFSSYFSFKLKIGKPISYLSFSKFLIFCFSLHIKNTTFEMQMLGG
jgi:hypothetical protein